jgi:predicted RNase H-like HicB family nuclease
MLHYSILVQKDSEESVYFVTVPALPGCFAQGATIEQAIERAREAIALHVEGFVERGEPVPVETVPPLLTVVEVESPAMAVA